MQTEKERRAEKDSIFADFAYEALAILLIATLVLAWAWTGYVGLFDSQRVGYAYTVFAIALFAGAAVYYLAQKRLRLAVFFYLCSLLAAITLVVLAYNDASLLALYLLTVLVAAPLTRPRGLGAATLLTLTTLFAVGIWRSMPLVEMVTPTVLTMLAALTAWLSTRRLFTALEWALNMTEHARRSAEEAREHRAELQRVLHSLDLALSRLERSNRALAFAQEAAERAYRFKSEFVANVSHELRTPLNLIVGFSEMMITAPESYGGKSLPGEYRGDMLAIYRSSRHLLDLINDVLDLSQIESGRMAIHKERVLIQDVIQEAVEIVRGLAEARRLQLVVEAPKEPLAVDLDRVRIRQVLLNLLTNAMRYTEQGCVCVRAASDGQELTVLVQDSGRGIAPEKLARAFEAFDRLDEEQLTHGSGLGLAVSKKFVELHDGRMWIESELGRGTTVGFTLPLPTQNRQLVRSSLHTSRPLPQENRQPLTLLIHNDTRALALLRRHIANCEFVLAETVEEAQALMKELAPDAVIVEPGSLGEWKRLIAAHPAASETPVLIAPLPSTRQTGAAFGASYYLPKPVGREDIAFVLKRLGRAPRTALVVDDDPHIVRLIGRMLRSVSPDIQVMEAFGGEEALALAQARPPDVIFVDLYMPGMNGEALIQAVQLDPRLTRTTIVVVSVRSVEQELAPIQGELWIRREHGFTLSELLCLIEANLCTLTQADATSPTSAAARLATLADSPA
uniref:histidine kinase n=1 Tax=Caldilinea aerophila TaxID=133453 RepID=A0A7C1JYR0_9CHLR